MRALSHGLRVSTFPWGRVTDMREKESSIAILRLKNRRPTSYPGLRATLAQRAGGQVQPNRRITEESFNSRDSHGIGRALELCPTTTYLLDPSHLPHRHYYEQSSKSRQDSVPHSGCVHSVCMGALDPVIDDLGVLNPVHDVSYGFGLEPR
ncbi:hypothetical protein CRG98_030464 [Punica granatum]|uniref:Uncharacterized protein n=1 Tax=Punica granatum TaxID=22663 RepID=A0A2I0IYN7_PUNGR|nr:hypothetical protein CRG98_030464 [Punica granatum]